MLLQLVSSPICNVIFVIFTHTSDPCLMRGDCRQGIIIKRGSLVSVNIRKITLQMGLNTSCDNIKDVLSPRLMRRDFRQGKDVFNVVKTCVQSHLY
jgi:hypothetical protein